MTDSFEARPLPFDLDIEAAMLGDILMDNRALDAVADFLKPHHFASGEYSSIYAAILDVVGQGTIADVLTVTAHGADGDTLAKLMGGAGSGANAVAYGRQILELHQHRRLIQIGESIIERAYKSELDSASSMLEDAEAALYQITENTDERSGPDAMTVALDEFDAAQRGEPLPGIDTGLVDLDRIFGRLRPQGLYIIAGRPSMGKTVLAMNIADHVAKKGKPTLVISVDQSAEELEGRRLCAETRISISRLLSGDTSMEEIAKVVEASHDLRSRPLVIDDTPAVSVGYIRRKARRMARKTGLGLIVVDYLQLMTAKGDGRVQEVSEITRGLKALAKELEVPVLAVSQLSRAVEQRDNKRPQLSDLRDSGTIEQDANVVLFIFREEYYLERQYPVQRENEKEETFNKRCETRRELLAKTANLADLIVAKNKQGPIGSVPASFHGEMMQFGNASHQEDTQI